MYRSNLDGWERATWEGKLSQAGKVLWLPNELKLELARACKELAKVKMERDLPKNLQRISREKSRRKDAAMKFGQIHELRQVYPVAAMCSVLRGPSVLSLKFVA